MSSIELYAGPRALAMIRANGLEAEQFRILVGASGGPKWFVLYGLDRYLFGEFFSSRKGPLATMGSSAGAWRLACLATAEPVAAIERLAELYSEERYSDNPTPEEVTGKARAMLLRVLGADGSQQIVDNQLILSHFFATRCRGPLSRNSRLLLGGGLVLAATTNLLSRRQIRHYFERAMFNSAGDAPVLGPLRDIATIDIKLTEQNVQDALIASGSIPFALEGVRDPVGGPAGLYVDGGIIDYHFDLPFHQSEDLVLYPHFHPRVVPGWFDKYLPWRRVTGSNFDNVLMVVPTGDFVERLPYRKIPDRSDFTRLPYDDRVKYWKTVLNESHRLAEDFARLAEKDLRPEEVRPFNPAQR